ncbi:SsgA family sporulation/cell division regulator [Kitasatospora sp. NPDC006697]|uniref:SsgA family sporulation/cell division regulator n=1 Tax=Kitasatospora sp. NPDC006697 TaxID=3364020 RepID=UPI0036C37777
MPGSTERTIIVALPYSELPMVRIPAQLEYDTSLPYGVCITFTPAGNPVRWYFGRDLLNEGRLVPSGCGDVRVAPGDAGRTMITLRAWGKEAVIAAPTEDVTAFLADTYALVPAGAESQHIDVDEVLERILL